MLLLCAPAIESLERFLAERRVKVEQCRLVRAAAFLLTWAHLLRVET